MLVLLLIAMQLVFPPRFTSESVLPSRGSRPERLSPGMLVSIYGMHLSGRGLDACGQERPPWPEEMCGTRVMLAGRPARLLYVSDRQINLQVPEGVPGDGSGEIRVLRNGVSAAATLRFGPERAVLELAEPAYAGMPVWIRVTTSYRWQGGIRYPFNAEPWNWGTRDIEVRKDGRMLAPLRLRSSGGVVSGFPDGSVAPGDGSRKHSIPLHTQYWLDRPGTYEVRYRHQCVYPESGVQDESEWTKFTVLPPTAEQKAAWLARMAKYPRSEEAWVVTDYLPDLLASRDLATRKIVESYTRSTNNLISQYARHGLAYFEAARH
ncbi:MAG TPA: hypothetical protein VN428_26630 [Bryobacteraceae bacterium]|nr:hypothetical protein [Bryobacteraceae bacterium]